MSGNIAVHLSAKSPLNILRIPRKLYAKFQNPNTTFTYLASCPEKSETLVYKILLLTAGAEDDILLDE